MRQADEAESILRASFAFTALESKWRWTLEGTENYLNIESQIDQLNGSGELIPIDLDGASSRVE